MLMFILPCDQDVSHGNWGEPAITMSCGSTICPALDAEMTGLPYQIARSGCYLLMGIGTDVILRLGCRNLSI